MRQLLRAAPCASCRDERDAATSARRARPRSASIVRRPRRELTRTPDGSTMESRIARGALLADTETRMPTMRTGRFHVLLQSAALLLLASGLARAADRPIPADRLLIRDGTHPQGAKLRFSAGAVPALTPGSLDDPRVGGGRLEIVGTGSDDGATGVIPLPPARWTALGGAGAITGYEYVDPAREAGIKRIVVRTGSPGSVLVVGAGAALPYLVANAQSAIDVRLTVGDDVYCARLASFRANGPSRVVATDAAAPAQCAARVVRCGNRVADGSEECDDGNAAAGDGCSPSCDLTDPRGACAGVTSAFGDGIATQLVTAELETPTSVTAAPLDPRRLFVTEQEGSIRVIEDGVLLATPFLDIADDVLCCGERGLFSIAFDPQYATNRRFFVYYNDDDGALVIARFEATSNPNVADAASRRVLLRIPHPGFANHNGGQLAFGPDGYLYAGTGDGGGGGDPGENAQDPASLLGKLLRIDVDVERRPWRRVPADNPRFGAGAKRGLIWADGLRNPWRFGFDRATGDLFIADVGQGNVEEIDFQPASSSGNENYGWDVFEGASCFEPTPPAQSCPDRTPYTFPVLEYDHDEGCSVTGGYVYRGCALPDLHGTYFYSDFCTSFVRTFRGITGDVAQDRRDRSAELDPPGTRALNNVVSFGEDARGEMYVVDRDGELYRIVPAPR
jgi:cysteine-rich repeat protein